MVLNFFKSLGLGELPASYNKAIHGPYDPARFYGKKDTPFAEVKLGEVPAWLSRRSKHPVDAARAVSRAYWRWQQKYIMPRNAGLSGYIQATAGLMFVFYVLNSERIMSHKNTKHQW